MPRLNGLQFVRQGVSEGWSAERAYREMISERDRLSEETGEAWTGIRRNTFQQMYSGTRLARENIGEALNAPRDIPAGGLSIPERPSTVQGGFLSWVKAFSRPIGQGEVEETLHPFRTLEAITPSEAEELARQQIEESAMETHGTFARYTIEALLFVGTQKLTGGARV